jgi:hypothetical protein
MDPNMENAMTPPDGLEQRTADAEERAARDSEFDELLTDERACDFCDGSGLRSITYMRGDVEFDADDQPCPECNPNYCRVRP